MRKTNSEIVFSARDLRKVYTVGQVEVHALRGVDLELTEGEFVVMLGASGSGKSTLLNILGGLDSPSSGQVFFRDRDLACATRDQLTSYRRESVGFIFQFYNLIPSLTAEENVNLITEIAANPMPSIEALGMVGLEDRSMHFPSQLSGGEQQRVAIARAIAKRPDILLCDEPTGALDFSTGKLVLRTLFEVNRTLGTLCVVITHNSAIGQLADRVITLADGKIRTDERNPHRKKLEDISW
jgi:putative ABC transport system ATP-binding protein